MSDHRVRMPVVFIPHGGGPWPFVEMGLPPSEIAELTAYLRSVRTLPHHPPRALLVVSAHWEEAVPTVMTAEQPPIYYDYYGFPPESWTKSHGRRRGIPDLPRGSETCSKEPVGEPLPIRIADSTMAPSSRSR